MTAHDRDRFEQKMFTGKDKGAVTDDIRANMVALSIVDEFDKLMFSKKDIKMLGGKSAAAMNTVFSAVQKLNGVSDDDIEEIAGNSEETQDDLSDGE